jgi:hypothetical protein
MKICRSFTGRCLLIFGLCFLSLPALATDQLDLKVGLKVLPLLTNKITGTAVAAIVYEPSNPESKVDADAIKSVIDGGLEAPGGVKLTGVLVPSNDLGKLSDAKIVFMVAGLTAASQDAVSKATSDASALTISTNLDYVKANKCVIGVVSKPSVQIYYSKAAADAGKIGFAQAFTMLVNQI